MTDEAHFHLTGFVNRQNMKYWSDENMHEIVEKPLHSLAINAVIGL